MISYVWIEYIQADGRPGNILTEESMIENWVAWMAQQGITEYVVMPFESGHVVEKAPKAKKA